MLAIDGNVVAALPGAKLLQKGAIWTAQDLSDYVQGKVPVGIRGRGGLSLFTSLVPA